MDDPDESLALTGKMARLTREHPEWVTPYIWADLAASWRRLLPGVTPIGDPAKFFSPPIPRGSVQGFRGRGGLPEVKQHPDLLIAASRMDFYDPGLAKDSSKALGENTAAFEKRVGRLTEYSLSVLHELVRRTVTEPDVCAGWLEKASALDPADYLRLGRYQGVHGKLKPHLPLIKKDWRPTLSQRRSQRRASGWSAIITSTTECRKRTNWC